jgi:hypothetical protein
MFFSVRDGPAGSRSFRRPAGYLGQFGYVSSNSGFAAPASGEGQHTTPATSPNTGNLWVATAPPP